MEKLMWHLTRLSRERFKGGLAQGPMVTGILGDKALRLPPKRVGAAALAGSLVYIALVAGVPEHRPLHALAFCLMTAMIALVTAGLIEKR